MAHAKAAWRVRLARWAGDRTAGGSRRLCHALRDRAGDLPDRRGGRPHRPELHPQLADAPRARPPAGAVRSRRHRRHGAERTGAPALGRPTGGPADCSSARRRCPRAAPRGPGIGSQAGDRRHGHQDVGVQEPPCNRGKSVHTPNAGENGITRPAGWDRPGFRTTPSAGSAPRNCSSSRAGGSCRQSRSPLGRREHRTSNRCWKRNCPEGGLIIEIVFAGLIDHAQLP
jgi:hypothetical protein